jgi:hypothetical protein
MLMDLIDHQQFNKELLCLLFKEETSLFNHNPEQEKQLFLVWEHYSQ